MGPESVKVLPSGLGEWFFSFDFEGFDFCVEGFIVSEVVFVLWLIFSVLSLTCERSVRLRSDRIQECGRCGECVGEGEQH